MALAVVLVLLVIGSIVFHFLSPWWFTPIASNWDTIDDTVMITFWITGFVFAAINLFVAYAVVRYRYNKNNRAEYQPENKKLETWLTGLTTLGVVAMLTPGLFVWANFINVPEDADVFEAIGQQWQWTYRFPGKDGKMGASNAKLINGSNPFGLNPDDPNGQDDILVQSSEVHIPLGSPVKVLLRSKDVLHNFAVPQFRVKMDLVPGLVSYLWFTPTREGRFEIMCEELCGIGHHAMRGHVVVEKQQDFQKWLAEQPTFAQTLAQQTLNPEGGLIAQGRAIAQSQGCLGCHSLDGSPSAGPTWKDLYGKSEKLADGMTILVDEEYLIESVVDPNAKIVQGYAPIMMPYQLSDDEMKALVAFMISGDEQAEVNLIEKGQSIAQANGCLGCHSIDGSPSAGPTWKGLFGKTEKLQDGSSIVVDEDYLIESIVDPNAKIVEGYAPIMAPYKFDKEELEALVAFTKDGMG